MKIRVGTLPQLITVERLAQRCKTLTLKVRRVQGWSQVNNSCTSLVFKITKLERSLKENCSGCDSGDEKIESLERTNLQNLRPEWVLARRKKMVSDAADKSTGYYWFWLRSYFGRLWRLIWVEWLGWEPDCRDLRTENHTCVFNDLINVISRNVFKLGEM